MNDPGPIFETRAAGAARHRPFLEALTGSPLWQLTLVRFREFVREPEALFWAFLFPTVLAVLLGVAFRNRPAESLPVASVTPELTRALRRDKTLDARQMPPGAAEEALRSGKVALMAAPGPAGSVIYRYDDTNPEGRAARMRADAAVQRAAGRADPVSSTDLLMREPGSRYIDFLIPGLLGMNLMNSGMWGVGFALVEMRQRKLLKRFVATPMRRSDFLLALTSSRLILMVIEVGLLLSFGVLVFHMPLQGSIVSVILLGSLGAITFGGVGLLTACRAQKIESVSGLINLVMMPMWIFSGVFFSYDRFPAIAHPFIKALPLTALNDALRATIIEGATLGSQSGRLLVLAIWGGVSFILALRWFRWT
jgi:ABC-type multidrug transport system permease subunit